MIGSVAQLCPTLQLHESLHARPPCPSPTPGVHPNSCPSSWWCHPAISSSVVPFLLLSSIPPSIRVFSNESSLHMRWPKYWSFSFSISLRMNTQDCSPLGWTCWMSLQSKGLLRVFSNTTVLKHQWLVGELKIFIVTYEIAKSQTWLSDWAELMSILAKGIPTIMTGS